MDTAILSAGTLLDVEPVGLTVAGFATACGVSRMTANRWVNAGTVAHIEVNGKKIITTTPEDFNATPTAEGQWSVPDFAAACGVTRQTVYRWIKQGLIDTVTVGGKVRITTGPDEERRS